MTFENIIDIDKMDDDGYIISFKYHNKTIYYQGIISGQLEYAVLPINNVIKIYTKLGEFIERYRVDNKIKTLEDFIKKGDETI